MRSSILYIVLFLLSLPNQARQHNTALPDSLYINRIRIEGNTNINSFYLEYEIANKTLLVLNDLTGKPFPDNKIHQLKLPLHAFKMDNEHMKRDFLDLMQSNAHPHLIIEITQSELLKLKHNINNLKFTIIIAGKRKDILIHCKQKTLNNTILLSGNQCLRLSDFNIHPRTYFYVIKIKDEILINFEFLIKD